MNKRNFIADLKYKAKMISRELDHIGMEKEAEGLTEEDKKFLDWRETLYIGRHMELEEIIVEIELGILK